MEKLQIYLAQSKQNFLFISDETRLGNIKRNNRIRGIHFQAMFVINISAL